MDEDARTLEGFVARGRRAQAAVDALGAGVDSRTFANVRDLGGDRQVGKGSARVVAIAAHKGGVGKTTTALGLGAALARGVDARVLVVDLDPQGCATRGLVGRLPYQTPGTADLLCPEPAPIAELLRATSVPNLSMLHATNRLATVERWLTTAKRVELLARALADVRDQFDWIFIDCPPSLNALLDVAFAAATDVIVPVKVEGYSYFSVRDLVKVLEVDWPALLASYRVLVTDKDDRNSDLNKLLEELEEFPRFATHIPHAVSVSKAQAATIDIHRFNGGSTASAAYMKLAHDEVLPWRAAIVTG